MGRAGKGDEEYRGEGRQRRKGVKGDDKGIVGDGRGDEGLV